MNATIDTSFYFDGKPIRLFIDETSGTSWFCAKDVCAVLGYAEVKDVLRRRCPQYGRAQYYQLDRLNRKRLYTFIDERNCYRLIDASRSPAAERFDQWLGKEVLPELRQTGQAKGHAHGFARPQLLSAFRNQRWLVDCLDIEGRPIFAPLAARTIVIQPEFLFDVLRKPDKVSLSLLPDIIRACVGRLEQAQPVQDQKEKAPSSF